MIEKKHLPWLDLLRFLAAFEVLAAHARGFFFVEYGSLIETDKNFVVTAFYALTRLGYEAVIVFFVLSGFLVGGKGIERLVNNSFNSRDYIIDRLVRIMIPLVPAILLTIVCDWIIVNPINFKQVIGNLFSLQGILVKPLSTNAPLWSLSYEFWFYMLIFFVSGIVLNKSNRWIWFLTVVFMTIIFTILNSTYLFCFLIGALVYSYRSMPKSNTVLFLSILFIILCLIMTQISIASKSMNYNFFRGYIPGMNILYLILSASFAVLVQQVILRSPKRRIGILIENKSTFLAAFSYTLYLTHYPILNLLTAFGFEKYNQISFTSISVYLFSVFICVLAAYLLYLPFEKRTDKYKSLIKQIFIKTT